MEAEERRNLEQLPCEVNCFPFPSPSENLSSWVFRLFVLLRLPFKPPLSSLRGQERLYPSRPCGQAPLRTYFALSVLYLYGKYSGFVSVIALSCAGHTVGAQLWAG